MNCKKCLLVVIFHFLLQLLKDKKKNIQLVANGKTRSVAMFYMCALHLYQNFFVFVYNCAPGFSRLLYDISETKIFLSWKGFAIILFISSRSYIICSHVLPEVRCFIILQIYPFSLDNTLNFKHFYLYKLLFSRNL